MCISVVLMFFSQRLDETKKKKDYIFLNIWIIFLRESYQTHDTHYLSLLLISFLSRQKKLNVFFGKEEIYIDFNTVMRNDRPKGNQCCMYTCMICKSENKNLKCHEEIVILNVFCVKWKSDLIVVLYCICRERTGEGEREREEKER